MAKSVLMNQKGLMGAWVLSFATLVQAGLWQSGEINVGQYVPDGNLTGVASTYQASGWDTSVQDVRVTLNFSGGYSGDLYAYLSHEGVLVPLLNRIGMGTGSEGSSVYNFGFSAPMGSVALSDSASTDVHTSGPGNGAYQPDGRAISPLSSGADFAGVGSGQRVGFSAFDNKNANGAWTLFVADTVGGDQSQLVGWSLEVEAVPEPVNVALVLFGSMFGGAILWKRLRIRHCA